MVRAKKHLGQHFLKNPETAGRIAEALSGEGYSKVLEIGPGMGVLTQHLLAQEQEVFVVEIDTESVHYLEIQKESNNIVEGGNKRTSG